MVLLVIFVGGSAENQRSTNRAEEILHLNDLGKTGFTVTVVSSVGKSIECEREKGIEIILLK